MNKKLSLLKRIGILSILCFCLSFIAFSNDTSSASARPCCSSCEVNPIDPVPSPHEYCTDLCGSDSACYSECLSRIQRCWRICDFGC